MPTGLGLRVRVEVFRHLQETVEVRDMVNREHIRNTLGTH